MNLQPKISRPLATFGLAVLLALTMAITVFMADQPTVALRGGELRRVGDTVQLIATVSLKNVPKSGGITLVLNYNPDYLTPSSMTDNSVLPIDTLDYEAMYEVDQDLYGGKDPFYPNSRLISEGSMIYFDYGIVNYWNDTIAVVLQPQTSDVPVEEPKVKSFKDAANTDDLYQLYIDASGTDETKLAHLSFQVKENMLPTVVRIFDGKENAVGLFEADYLVKVDTSNSGSLQAEEKVQLYTWGDDGYPGAPIENPATAVSWHFDDMLIDAVSAKEEVTINAYQAYGNGTPLDLADALLRYSPTVRGTHANGKVEDYTLYWGESHSSDGGVTEDGGCYIATGEDNYHLVRASDGSYTVQKYNKNEEKWESCAGDWYSPLGGDYTITQTFFYDLQDGKGEQVYKTPIEVKLTVKPVTVTGVTAEDLTRTYRKTVEEATTTVPKNYSELQLPGTAQLTTDIVPGQVSLTMPISGWTSTNNNTTGNPAVDGLNVLHGTVSDSDATDVTWDGVGTYHFAAPVYTPAMIRAVYPWLTVKADHGLRQATRIIQSDAVPEYEVYSGGTDDDGLLTLKVAKKVDGVYGDMNDGDTFRLKLPNGTIIDSTWPSDYTGTYRADKTGGTAGDGGNNGKADYTIQLQAKKGATDEKNELVRRSINLGGYFQVEVTEDGQASEFVGRYVAPRTNYYSQSYVGSGAGGAFDFTGDNAALYPFYEDSVLPDYVVLPSGYSVTTTYDGQTGAEPGELTTFKVDAWTRHTVLNGSWNSGSQKWVASSSGTPVQVQYGYQTGDGRTYDAFASFAYPDFGTVSNAGGSEKLVQMNVEVQGREDQQAESLLLTYGGQGDAVLLTSDPIPEVQRVIFDARQVGYKYRQNVTLTLTNNGTTEINDLYIDNAGEAAHAKEFIITQQPARDLPAGASTTFTVSYVLDLSKGWHTAIDTPLKIYSSRSNTTPVKTFQAELNVVDEEIYQLFVITDPADGSWGTAGPVKGPAGSPVTLDATAVPFTFAADSTVYLLAEPKKNYSVAKIYYLDGTTEKTLSALSTPKPAGEYDVLTSFAMPHHDMVVYVVFEESLKAKLELVDLQDWSGTTDEALAKCNDDTGAGHQLPLMLHDGGDEISYATDVSYSPVRTSGDYDYDPERTMAALIDPDDAVKLNEDEYLVVIPTNASRSQIRFTLRGDISELTPDVEVWAQYSTPNRAYQSLATTMRAHTSECFDSPNPGEQLRVTIELTCKDAFDHPVQRVYTLIIARRYDPDQPLTYPLNPGNSPYGMIQWDGAITNKTAAKEAYNENDRFASGYIPTKASGLILTYWDQAWGVGPNYDRMDEALFVFAGEAFEDYGPMSGRVTNTAGDVIPNSMISRSLTGLRILNETMSPQQTQFTTANTTELATTIDLGKASTVMIAADAWGNQLVRPGVYTLTYSYADFDGATMTFARPLIVLNPLGDVNGDKEINTGDARMIDKRVTAPLGYEADYPDAALFGSRVCDTNNDRNMNQIDANTVRGEGSGLWQFYKPTDYAR